MGNRAVRLLAIDPGLTGTGAAVWTRSGPVPDEVFVVKSDLGKKADWIDRCANIAGHLMNIIHTHEIESVVCEMMEMHSSARAQMMWRAGDFQRTLVLIGTIHGMAIENQVKEFAVVPPSVWKGQLPKEVMERRIRRIVGDRQCERLGIQTHAWDAVGIGLWERRFIK